MNPTAPGVPPGLVELEKRIEPAFKDRMVRTMVVLLERQETDQLDDMLLSSYEQQNQQQQKNPYMQQQPPAPPRGELRSKLSLLSCNVPLPPSVFTALTSYNATKGFKTFLVKGLLSGVVKSLDLIKEKLATPPPALPSPLPQLPLPPLASSSVAPLAAASNNSAVTSTTAPVKLDLDLPFSGGLLGNFF